MGTTRPNEISVNEIESLFNSGKVMLFKCSLDNDFPLTYVSANVEEVVGFPRSYFLENNPSWSSRIHPNDKPDVMKSFAKVIEKGTAVNEYRFKTNSGDYIWLRDKMRLIEDEQERPQLIIGYSWVVAKELDLERQEEEKIKPYEYSIARCSHLLLNNKPDAVQKMLRILMGVAEADRAYIFENHVNNEGILCASQKFEATAGNVSPRIDNSELQNMPYSIFPWWEKELSRQRVINELSKNMPPAEKELLEEQGIKSILILPVYVDGEWDGFIGFDDVKKERYWTPDEVKLLEIAAEIYGSFKKWVGSQQKLTLQKNFNQAVIDSLPGVFLAMDEDYNVVQWNKNVEKISGIDHQKMVSNKINFWKTISDSDAAKYSTLLAEGSDNEIEIPIQTGRGRRVPYLWKFESFTDGEQPTKLAIGIDISEQKRIMQERKKNEELFKTLFSKAPVAITMSSKKGKLKMVNKSFENLFGYSENEIIGKKIDDIILPADQKSVGSYSIQPIHGYEEMPNIDTEAKRRTKNGELLDMIVAGIPVFVDDKPIAGFGLYIDISDLKTVEANLKESLEEKQILLQEIHHRVKNNLAVISSLLQLQIFQTDDEGVQKLLQESQTRVQTMALIHEQLYQTENLSRIHLQQYVGELVEFIRQAYEMQDKQIEVQIDVDSVELNINKAIPFGLLLNEILSNSYDHAFKNRDSGTIFIQISQDEDVVNAKLSDDGVGINEDLASDSDGLGMKLIRSLAKQLDAEYQIDSQDGMRYAIRFTTDFAKGSSTILND